MREQWQLEMPGKIRSVCFWLEFEDITCHPPSSSRDGPRVVHRKGEQADPRRRRDRQKLTQDLVLQPALEEGRVLLLEEERQPRAARLDDAVPQRGQPRL